MPPTTGRREHLEEDKFLRELEKMYNEGRRDGNGNVAVSFSKMSDKWWQKEVARKAKKNKKKGPAAQVAGGVEKKSHAVVRGKRKGKTISCLIRDDAVLKFQLQLANLLRASVDTLKRAERSAKAKKEKREKQKAKREAAKAEALKKQQEQKATE